MLKNFGSATLRLSEQEKKIIKSVIREIFGEAKVYLFGSRLDDTKRGGDIDLFVVAQDKTDLLHKKIKALARLERALHKPVDIVVHKNFDRAIEQEAMRGELI